MAEADDTTPEPTAEAPVAKISMVQILMIVVLVAATQAGVLFLLGGVVGDGPGSAAAPAAEGAEGEAGDVPAPNPPGRDRRLGRCPRRRHARRVW